MRVRISSLPHSASAGPKRQRDSYPAALRAGGILRRLYSRRTAKLIRGAPGARERSYFLHNRAHFTGARPKPREARIRQSTGH